MQLIKTKDIASESGYNRAYVYSALVGKPVGNGNFHIPEQTEINILKTAIKLHQDLLQQLSNKLVQSKGFDQFDTIQKLSDAVFCSDKVQPVAESESTEFEQIYVDMPDGQTAIVTASENLCETAVAIEQLLKGNIQFIKE